MLLQRSDSVNNVVVLYKNLCSTGSLLKFVANSYFCRIIVVVIWKDLESSVWISQELVKKKGE